MATQIANASECTIMVLCEGDSSLVTRKGQSMISIFGGSFGLTGGSFQTHGRSADEISLNEHAINVAGNHWFTKIPAGEVIGFQPKNNGTVYTSIYSVQDGDLVPLCTAFPRQANHSLIVTMENAVRPSQPGSIWIDESTGQDVRHSQ